MRIRGLALLDDVGLDLAPGLNVLTGETGAGKSIIVDALTLLRGVKGTAELVRAGDEQAIVDGAFALEGVALERARAELARHGLPTGEAEELVVQRQVARKGRGRATVQGELVARPVLAAVAGELLDVCSQHEHHSLTQPARHGELLDAYGKLDGQVSAYAVAYDAWAAAARELARVRELAQAGAQRVSFLRFQVEELERACPRAGEHTELGARLALLRDAHRWASFAAAVQEVLEDAEDSVQGRLGRLAEQARRGGAAPARVTEVLSQLDAAAAACSEAVRSAARLGGSLEVEPGELERAEGRYFELESLRRKHGVDAEQLPQKLVDLQGELASTEGAEEQLEALGARVEGLLVEARRLAGILTERRRAAGKQLSAALCRELAALHMPFARLEASVEPREDGGLGPRGADRVEFLFSANAGEPLLPLNRVASGGELSRVLLALKGVLTTGDTVATYVFDEVDAGVGGAVAEAIGRRLARAAERHQVLCITHLPQIAAFAEQHFRVEKVRHGGRTLTRVRALSQEESVEEMARMLGGAKVTASARDHARQLRDEARRGRKRVGGPSVPARLRPARVA